MPNPESESNGSSRQESSKSSTGKTPGKKKPLLERLGIGSTASQSPKRRVSRRERDDRRTRILYVALGIATAAIVLILAGQALNQYVLKPRKVLASVNGEDITRRDYWKYHSNTLVNQISQYQQFANMMTGEQQQQYLAMAQQASAELNDVWGTTDTDPTTLNQMIDDKVYVDGLQALGISISDEDVQNYIDNQFANADAPVFTPTPSPTLIPERAEWATQTATALAATEASGSPTASTPEAVDTGASGSPAATPEAIASPVQSESTPETSNGSPVAASPEPAQTPNQDQARQTATANFDGFTEQVFELTHMSKDDYNRLVARPAVAREEVAAHFREELGQSSEQVHAEHILVGTKELADRLYAEAQANPDSFEQLAIDNSIDTGTAPNGGDLGWFARGVMVEPFENVAFELESGQISEPVQTEFGWHIIRAVDHAANRALTDEQIDQTGQALTDRWLQAQREANDISSTIDPTPTPSSEQFIPPPGAPPAPTPAPEQATPVAAAATPIADSSPVPIGTP